MPPASTAADRLLRGDRLAAAELATRLLRPRRDNLVERPWGGMRLRAFKGLPPAGGGAGPFGESFEIAADDGDDEARRYPSALMLSDGSTVSLAALLAVHADIFFGEAFVARYGRRHPLLPKLLDVAELLSVQAHPPGNTEVYVIVAADQGATIRLGFARDVSPTALAEQLHAGRREQQRLLGFVTLSADELQALLKPWLARRDADPAELAPALHPALAIGAKWSDVEVALAALKRAYWAALDALNEVPVRTGDVIYNANPQRIVAQSGGVVSAEIHALGNPEGRGVLALEIRRPGPTYRAWDNVRFPLRAIDVDAALAAVNLRATRREEYFVPRRLVRAGVERSVECEYFRLEHLKPTARAEIDVKVHGPHSLHALDGRVALVRRDGEDLGLLERGESALVPVGVGAYRVAAIDEPAEIVKVEVPPYVD